MTIPRTQLQGICHSYHLIHSKRLLRARIIFNRIRNHKFDRTRQVKFCKTISWNNKKLQSYWQNVIERYYACLRLSGTATYYTKMYCAAKYKGVHVRQVRTGPYFALKGTSSDRSLQKIRFGRQLFLVYFATFKANETVLLLMKFCFVRCMSYTSWPEIIWRHIK